MAILSQEQLNKILAQSGKHPDIDGAVKEEARAKFHTESTLASGFSAGKSASAYNEFIKWVQALIDKNKYSIFQALLTTPIQTIDVTQNIFNEVSKIFEGQDRFVGYQFVNEKQRTDFELYLKSINDDRFWRTDGMLAIKNGYNSIVIVDLPYIDEYEDKDVNPDLTGLQLQSYPAPYYYILAIENVIWLEIDPTERDIEWIFFYDCEDKTQAYIFDDAFFRTYSRVEDHWVEQSAVPHNLGYVPAKQFWSENLSSESLIRKRGLITNSLGNLDKLLFKQVSETHVDLYAEYPITSMYSQKCDYVDAIGNTCESGRVKALIQDGIGGQQQRETYIPCPKCGGGLQTLGAGTVLEAPAMTKQGDPDLIDAIKFITVPTENLKWIAEKVNSLENKITYSIIGVTDEINKGVAINKDQVASQYESRQNVLMSVKNQMEDVHRWAHETLAKLRYGKSFLSATVNYGTKFFIQTASELMKDYIDSRTAGIPSYELANQRSAIYETKYRSNPEMLQRIRILSNLEPYQDYSIQQIKELLAMGNIFDKRLLTFKLDFDNYIKRFERENVDVNTYMQYSDFSEKISIMNEILLGYVDEAILLNPPPPPPPQIMIQGAPPATPSNAGN